MTDGRGHDPATRSADRAVAAGRAPMRTIVQTGGRAKAYRPLPEADRRRAFDAFLEAYGRGEFFEAHELLEPAWMGSADLAERDLDQGLIKLAAAFVHAGRGNPLGIRRNLEGARVRLAAAAGTHAEAASGLDVTALLAAVDERLARLTADPTDAAIAAPALPRRPR